MGKCCKKTSHLHRKTQSSETFRGIEQVVICSVTVMIIITVTSIWLGWTYMGYERISNSASIEDVDRKEFDFIIVGSGSVGSVIASKLSSNENLSILLVEAGNMFGPLSIIPLLTTIQQNTSVDWAFRTIPQQYSSNGFVNNEQLLPRGKGLGGTSQLNYMLDYGDDLKKEFDKWETLAGPEWRFANMLKYVNEDEIACGDSIKIPQEACIAKSNSQFSAPNDLTSITESGAQLAHLFREVEEEFERTNDDVDFHLAQYHTRNGIRWSVYHKYLRPAFKNKNLKILYDSRVRKIHFTGNRASSILISPENNFQNIHLVHAKHEIILSAGAYQTPQILKLSGIGCENELKSHNIRVVKHVPSIGANLFDHINMPLYVSIDDPISLTKDKAMTANEILKYLFEGKGVYSNFGVIGFVSARNDDYATGLFGTGSIDEQILLGISNFKQETFRSMFPLYVNSSQEGFVLLCTCHHPKSRGTVKLRNKNPKTSPVIDPNYLHVKDDIDCMTKSIRLAVRLVHSNTFQRLNPRIHWPKLRNCVNFGPTESDFEGNFPSDRYLECLLRTSSITSHHPGGTCAIGTSLDSRLRIEGIEGLRVADASVFPTTIGGTPNSKLILIGKHAADIILEDLWTKNSN